MTGTTSLCVALLLTTTTPAQAGEPAGTPNSPAQDAPPAPVTEPAQAPGPVAPAPQPPEIKPTAAPASVSGESEPQPYKGWGRGVRAPIYLYVPEEHRLHWAKYCGRYAACLAVHGCQPGRPHGLQARR